MKINIDLFGSDSDVLFLSSLSQQIMSLLLIMINEKADERTMRENNDKSNLSLIIQFFLFIIIISIIFCVMATHQSYGFLFELSQFVETFRIHFINAFASESRH